MTRTIDFSKYSSIKIGTPIDVNIIDEKKDITDGYLIGGANNLLISPNPPKLYMLSKRFDYIMIEDNKLKIGASTKSGRIYSFCKKHNIGGFEYLGKLPGTLGGLLKMNAGMKSFEIFNHLIMIELSDGYHDKDSFEFGYRYTNIQRVIFEGVFEIKKGFNKTLVEEFTKMRANQPKEPSAGSAFKNPPNEYAGRLIEEVGLKGYKRGDAMWSNIHANFLINNANATFEDAKWLIDEAKKRVYESFGIKLKEEIKIL